MEKVTAGRAAMGAFAPNSRSSTTTCCSARSGAGKTGSPQKNRSLVTGSALMAGGILDSFLLHHIRRAKVNGVTQEDMTESLTQLAFYAGWPKAWATLRMEKEIYENQ